MHCAIASKTVPRCQEPSCNGLVKPEIVFFGEQLPAAFFDNCSLPADADLCIVLGTSLSVYPFASLPQMCRDETPRLLINSKQVGHLGLRPDDVLLLGECDEGIRKLASACGWLEELEALWATTAREHGETVPKEEKKKSRDEILQDEVDKLTRDVEENLRLSKKQQEWLDHHVDEKIASCPQEERQDVASAAGLQASDDADSKVMGPVSRPGATKSHPGGQLDHVFPFLKRDALQNDDLGAGKEQ